MNRDHHQTSGVVNHYDTEDCSIVRFQGVPPELVYLVPGLMPLGTAGTLYGTGGTGKSILALNLAIQVASAHRIQSKWLGTFPIEIGGLVAYFSAEDSEDELHRRVYGLCGAIGEIAGISCSQVQEICKDNLRLVNLWGTGSTLFKPNTLEPTTENRRIKQTLDSLNKRGSVRLIVFDTRSILSGVEGSGNAAVSKEVTYYQRLAHDYHATVLIIHHTNKAGSGAIAIPALASRGEGSFLDGLRFGMCLSNLPQVNTDITDVSSSISYTCLFPSKLNYGPKMEPFTVGRDGFQFTVVDGLSPKLPALKKENRTQKTMDVVFALVQKNPGLSKGQLIEAAKSSLRISSRQCTDTLENLERKGLVTYQTIARGAKIYSVIEDAFTAAA